MIEDRDIEKLALLSRISISPEEKSSLRRDIEAVLAYISDITKVAGEAEGTPSYSPLRTVLRDDASPHESGVHTDAILSLAPEREGNYVKVKRILPAKS
jgi:aspartyl-tRNA(Asn)/glutamyl-tRNA(Gln) amidotransferase subunit C